MRAARWGLVPGAVAAVAALAVVAAAGVAAAGMRSGDAGAAGAGPLDVPGAAGADRTVAAAAAGGEPEPIDHDVGVLRPPVDAPVSDPFRAPDNPYGPGNRGIEYATGYGEPVRAAAAGVVVFAGLVAGELYVTVDHGGGLLTSYSYLSRLSVSDADTVSSGDVIGFTGERAFHFSARLHGEYIDPANFIGVRRVRVRLIHLPRR